MRQIFRKTNILYPRCMYQGVKNISFSETFTYVPDGSSIAKFTIILAKFPFRQIIGNFEHIS